eukprot:TRINITY_DN364_c0_g1_i1.p1 TRINITY_DN364_c0_g1~~TRINITY_DN364_c0_g1_i1.p1  ORF type:complete len:530 (+),score=65.96 TRINITY_DN364_c0_g1_i1:60-1649(+)
MRSSRDWDSLNEPLVEDGRRPPSEEIVRASDGENCCTTGLFQFIETLTDSWAALFEDGYVKEDDMDSYRNYDGDSGRPLSSLRSSQSAQQHSQTFQSQPQPQHSQEKHTQQNPTEKAPAPFSYLVPASEQQKPKQTSVAPSHQRPKTRNSAFNGDTEIIFLDSSESEEEDQPSIHPDDYDSIRSTGDFNMPDRYSRKPTQSDMGTYTPPTFLDEDSDEDFILYPEDDTPIPERKVQMENRGVSSTFSGTKSFGSRLSDRMEERKQNKLAQSSGAVPDSEAMPTLYFDGITGERIEHPDRTTDSLVPGTTFTVTSGTTEQPDRTTDSLVPGTTFTVTSGTTEQPDRTTDSLVPGTTFTVTSGTTEQPDRTTDSLVPGTAFNITSGSTERSELFDNSTGSSNDFLSDDRGSISNVRGSDLFSTDFSVDLNAEPVETLPPSDGRMSYNSQLSKRMAERKANKASLSQSENGATTAPQHSVTPNFGGVSAEMDVDTTETGISNEPENRVSYNSKLSSRLEERKNKRKLGKTIA